MENNETIVTKLIPTPVIEDNKRHYYLTNIDGEERSASYIATPYPIENEGPILIISYGLKNEGPQYDLTIHKSE